MRRQPSARRFRSVMCPDRLSRYQAGAGLPVALFIITVLALMVAGMAQLQQSSGQSISLQIQSQRAFFAAESGAQIVVRNVLDANSCGSGSDLITFSEAALGGCSASVVCGTVAADFAGTGSNTVFSVTSTGQCGAGADGAERVVEVRVR